MDCTTALEAIQDAMDGRLDPSASAALDAHVSACPACAEERRAFAGLRTALRALPSAQAPRGFTDGVMAGLGAAPKAAVPSAAPRGRLIRIRFALAAAAVAAAVVVVAVSTGGPDPTGDGWVGGTEIARNAAPKSDDPVSRAKRVLDEAVSSSESRLDLADAQATGMPAGAPRETAPSGAPAPAASKLEEQDRAKQPEPSTSRAGGDSSIDARKSEASPERTAAEEEKHGASAPPAVDDVAGAPAKEAGEPTRVVYALFATEADARVFLDGLGAAGVAQSEAKDVRRQAGAKSDKGARGGSGELAHATDTKDGAGGAVGGEAGGQAGGEVGDAGGEGATTGVHGFGARRSAETYLEFRRVSVSEMTPERRAGVDRIARAARGRLADTLLPAGAREPSDPPAAPAAGGLGGLGAPGAPGGLGAPGAPGAPGGLSDAPAVEPAKSPAPKRPSVREAAPAATSTAAGERRFASSETVLVIVVVGSKPAPVDQPVPAPPATPATKR